MILHHLCSYTIHMKELVHIITIFVYSGTSLNGLSKETSEIMTKNFGSSQYTVNKGISITSKNICGPKVFVIERFHCIEILIM